MKKELERKLKEAGRHIRQAKSVLLIGHISPDADALASLGAMQEIFNQLGARTYSFAENKPARDYDFIPHSQAVTSTAPQDLGAFDLIVVLDCGSLARTGLGERIGQLISGQKIGSISRRPYIIELDHHEPQDSYADLEIRLPDQASTTAVIYKLLKSEGMTINRAIADCILIGLLSDTGHFLYTNSSREALAVAAEMLNCGASLPKIISGTVHNKSFDSLKAWGRAMENMDFNPATGLAVSALTHRELEDLLPAGRSGSAELFNDIVAFLGTLSGVRVAMFLREEDGRIKGSLRSNSDEVDVAAIARKMGGGGHKKSAGFSLRGRLIKTAKGWAVRPS